MRGQPRVGLMPLYMKLYDDFLPDLLPQLQPWLESIATGLEAEGLTVVRGGVCRVADQFQQVLREFAAEDVDLVVTLHLAYSLSLESVDALAAAGRPILMLDTTIDDTFDQDVDPEQILLNHGIHGVQDLACMLGRRRVPVEIVAGHATGSDVLHRAAEMARAALAARRLTGQRVLRIGPPFAGMGDFAVDPEQLREALGMEVEQLQPAALDEGARKVSAEEIDTELRRDAARYDIHAAADVHRRSVRVGLALRRTLEAGGYDAFSMNFLAFDSADGAVDTVPFLEASKAMARGIGYAGEGDVLTAALVAALATAVGPTTFTEIFCPDWKGGTLFLSHMGEINPEVAATRPSIEQREFPWTATRSPAILACCPAPGPAVLVNLAPRADAALRLIIAPVEVLGDATRPAMRELVRGWIRPLVGAERGASRFGSAATPDSASTRRRALEWFLEQYSRLGGTHHSALVLGDHTEALAAMARFAGIEAVVMEG
jgi:L-arabinose isomerase